MPDIEKVISVLSAYKNHSFGDKAEKVTVEEIITMLKAQEPVTPYRDSFFNWHCGYCKTEIDRYEGHKYCPNCGRPVKWE